LGDTPGTKGKLVDWTNGSDVVVDAGIFATDVDKVDELDVVTLVPAPSAATNPLDEPELAELTVELLKP
jgi:hypothetical protein